MIYMIFKFGTKINSKKIQFGTFHPCVWAKEKRYLKLAPVVVHTVNTHEWMLCDVALLTILRAQPMYECIRAYLRTSMKEKTNGSGISTQSTSNRWSRRLCDFLLCLQGTHTHTKTHINASLCICVTKHYKNRRHTN